MITKSIKSILITALAMSLIFFISQFFQAELVFDRDKITQGEWWRIFTGNLTHSNFTHLLLNLAGFWILIALFIDYIRPALLLVSTIILGLAIGYGLYQLNTTLFWYYGFSGILYGLYAIGGTLALINNDRFTGISTLILIFGKVIWDATHDASQSISSANLIGMPVATDAHLYGVIGACLISLFLLAKHYLNLSHPP